MNLRAPGVFREIQYSTRKLLRTPGATLALLFTIALGIGVNASIGSFANGLIGLDPHLLNISRIALIFRLAGYSVFFVACGNVASSLLGRVFSRSYDTVIRIALGATRAALIQELLSDSIIIATVGGMLGVLLAHWTASIVPALLFAEDAEHLISRPNPSSIVSVSTACIGITIICGLIPVIAGPRVRAEGVLRCRNVESSKTLTRIREVLTIGQMASCCVLVIITALLFEGFHEARQTGAGQRLGDRVLITVQKEPSQDNGKLYFQQVQQAAESVAGVFGMAWAGHLPGSQPVWQSFRKDPPGLPLRNIDLTKKSFTPTLLEQFRLPPIQGSLFGFEDNSCRNAIVNEKAANELFGNRTAGRTLQDSAGMEIGIIGVVAEKKDGDSGPTIYYNAADRTGATSKSITSVQYRAAVRSELPSAELDANVVSDNYFTALAIPVTAGKDFDHRLRGDCRVALVNREAADLYFGSKAVGAAVIDDRGLRTKIIGIVKPELFTSFQRHSAPAIYFPLWHDSLSRMTLITPVQVRTDSVLRRLRDKIEAVPGRGPAPVVVETFDAYLAKTELAPVRIASVIIAASATIALMLSILGLLGTLSDAARERRRELTIRVALGDRGWQIAWRVLSRGVRLALAGSMLGTVVSLLCLRLLGPVIAFGRTPAVWVWLVSPLALTGAVLIAGMLPARRASIVNISTIMRDER